MHISYITCRWKMFLRKDNDTLMVRLLFFIRTFNFKLGITFVLYMLLIWLYRESLLLRSIPLVWLIGGWWRDNTTLDSMIVDGLGFGSWKSQKIFIMYLDDFHYSLPTNHLRVWRHLTTNPSCHRCGHPSQTIFHTIRHCLISKVIWNLLALDRHYQFYILECEE